MTLGKYCAPIRSKPVSEIATAYVLAVLAPIWHEKPETASRLRGRIEAVIASRRPMAGFQRTGQTRQGGRTGLTARRRSRRSSERAATTRRCRTLNCPRSLVQLAEIDPISPLSSWRISSILITTFSAYAAKSETARDGGFQISTFDFRLST